MFIVVLIYLCGFFNLIVWVFRVLIRVGLWLVIMIVRL